jgi:hypothetical protein
MGIYYMYVSVVIRETAASEWKGGGGGSLKVRDKLNAQSDLPLGCSPRFLCRLTALIILL